MIQGKAGSTSTTLSGAVSLLDNDTVWQKLNPNGATRVVTVAPQRRGRGFVIQNTGTTSSDILSIVDKDAAAVITLDAGESAFVVGTGTGLTSYPINQMTGNAELTMLINSNAAAGTNEDPALALLGGDGSTNLERTTLVQDSSAGKVSIKRQSGALGTTEASPTLHIGAIATTAAVNSTLVLEAGASSTNKPASFVNTGSTGVLAITGTTGVTLSDSVATLSLNAGAFTETALASIDLTPSGASTLNPAGANSIESSASAINIGANAVAQAVNVGTGAAARVITIGNAASASVSIDAGVGALTAQADTTVDIDAGGALSLNSSAGAINIGNDAVAQAVNIATGAAARVITVGNAASASLALEGGVGGLTAQADGAVSITAGTTAQLSGTTTTIQGSVAVAASIPDNVSNGFRVLEGPREYINVNTTDASEAISLGNATTNPTLSQLGTGQVSFAGNVDAANGLDVTTAALTAAAGLTVSGGVSAITGSDIDLDPTGHFTLDMDATKTVTTNLADNLDAAYVIKQGSDQYLEIDTRDAGAKVIVGNAFTNPTFEVLGSGQITLTGNVNATAGLDVTGGALTVASQAITQTGSGQVDFVGNVDASAGVDIDADSQALTVGASADFSLLHNGTDTLGTNTTGDLRFDNQAVTGKVQIDLGTDTSATAFEVRNNSGTALLKIDGAGTFTGLPTSATRYYSEWHTTQQSTQKIGFSATTVDATTAVGLAYDGYTLTASANGVLRLSAVFQSSGSGAGTVQVLLTTGSDTSVDGSLVDSIALFNVPVSEWFTVNVNKYVASGQKIIILFTGTLEATAAAKRLKVEWYV